MIEGLGPAQIAALCVLVQRGLEQLYSNHNTRRLLAAGARDETHGFFAVVAASHLGWIASVYFLIPPEAHPVWPILGLFVALQAVRYWIVGSLGRFWTHGVLTIDGLPLVRSGPYRFLRHPNYVLNVVETLVLPMAFGSLALGLIMAAICAAVMRYKANLEDAALANRSGL